MRKDLNSFIRTISPKKNNIYQQVTSLLKAGSRPLRIKNKILSELNSSSEDRPHIKVLNELDRQHTNRSTDLTHRSDNTKRVKETQTMRDKYGLDRSEDIFARPNIDNNDDYYGDVSIGRKGNKPISGSSYNETITSLSNNIETEHPLYRDIIDPSTYTPSYTETNITTNKPYIENGQINNTLYIPAYTGVNIPANKSYIEDSQTNNTSYIPSCIGVNTPNSTKHTPAYNESNIPQNNSSYNKADISNNAAYLAFDKSNNAAYTPHMERNIQNNMPFINASIPNVNYNTQKDNLNMCSQLAEIINENSVLKSQLRTTIPIENHFKNIIKEMRSLNTTGELTKLSNFLNELLLNHQNVETSRKENFANLKVLIEALKTFFVESIEMKFDATKSLKEEIETLKTENNYLKETEKILKTENEALINENRISALNFEGKVIEVKILKSENDNLNLLIEKLPILNLYEYQIKENIEKWFVSNQKSNLIRAYEKRIFSATEELENALGILENLFISLEKQKGVNQALCQSLGSQKSEIRNLQVFYENKIHNLEKNRDEGIWSAFDLSDL
ncbi:hypothetical protein CDIK_2200 [Cucumispora dikerogammari]|nr:hypothetical protein CDIK_2200 [Cucumispora dikerogammari]